MATGLDIDLDRSTSLMLSLARLMAGEFSNQQQSWAQPQTYAHIRIFFRPLPWDFFQGIGFYSEQVYDYDIWTPYRQGVHRLVPQETSVYIENYALKDAMLYAGAGHDRDILQTIKTESLERREHCAMVFHPEFRSERELFRGSVEPGNRCMVTRNGCPTYLVSEVELTETTWISWDRGMNPETHEQVWGSAAGPLRFEKKTSFATELPILTT